MLRPALIALALTLTAAPATATPLCLTGGGSGLSVQVHIGTELSEADRREFDKMTLRRAGIDAARVERDSFGCLKVWRRLPGGGEVLEFYDPGTLEQKPLDLRLR